MIIKASGEQVKFDAERIRRTMRRVGAASDVVEVVVRDVRAAVRPGMSTREILSLAQRTLAKYDRATAAKYDLKGALYRLGPAGFHFERYLAALLRAQGFETELPDVYQGGCVKQEVDVTARKQGKQFAIEAKLRQATADMVDLKVVMTQYARFLDLLDGAALHRCPKFDAAWVITNGQFSETAKHYAMCKGVLTTGWNHPEGQGLNTLIDRTGLYPLTIIPGFTAAELEAFSRADVMLCKELAQEEPEHLARRTGLSLSRIGELAEQAGEIAGDRVVVPAR